MQLGFFKVKTLLNNVFINIIQTADWPFHLIVSDKHLHKTDRKRVEHTKICFACNFLWWTTQMVNRSCSVLYFLFCFSTKQVTEVVGFDPTALAFPVFPQHVKIERESHSSQGFGVNGSRSSDRLQPRTPQIQHTLQCLVSAQLWKAKDENNNNNEPLL